MARIYIAYHRAYPWQKNQMSDQEPRREVFCAKWLYPDLPTVVYWRGHHPAAPPSSHNPPRYYLDKKVGKDPPLRTQMMSSEIQLTPSKLLQLSGRSIL